MGTITTTAAILRTQQDEHITMHYAILISLLGAVIAAPQRQRSDEKIVQSQQVGIAKPPPLLILKDERTNGQDGAYSFQFETENGIVHTETGNPGASGGATAQGTYSYVLEDGSIGSVQYIADENGFRVQSPLVPVAPAFPHPLPDHVVNNIRLAEEQKAAGIQFDNKGFRIN